MSLPTRLLAVVQIDQVELNEEMHCCQGNLTAGRIESIQNLPQMAHGLLLRCQGINESLPRNKIFGAKLSEVATWVGQSRRDVGDGSEDVGPVNGRGGDEDLEQQRVLLRQREKFPKRVVSRQARLITGDKVLTDTIGD